MWSRLIPYTGSLSAHSNRLRYRSGNFSCVTNESPKLQSLEFHFVGYEGNVTPAELGRGIGGGVTAGEGVAT